LHIAFFDWLRGRKEEGKRRSLKTGVPIWGGERKKNQIVSPGAWGKICSKGKDRRETEVRSEGNRGWGGACERMGSRMMIPPDKLGEGDLLVT